MPALNKFLPTPTRFGIKPITNGEQIYGGTQRQMPGQIAPVGMGGGTPITVDQMPQITGNMVNPTPTMGQPLSGTAMLKPGFQGNTITSTPLNGAPSPYKAGGTGGGSWTDFRFSNPADNQQSMFNQQMDAGNIDGAYYGMVNGAGRSALQSQWTPQMGDWNNLLNTYGGMAPSMGINPATGKPYGGGSRASRSVDGMGGGSFIPWQQATGGSTPPPGTPAPHGDNFPSTPSAGAPVDGSTGLPGTGGVDYSQPLTDVSAFLDPSMAFRLKQGEDAIQNSAAARGGLLSGNTLKQLTKYGQDMGSQEYANAFNRANSDRGFRYGVDAGDRDFAYRAQTGDRDFGYNAQRDDRNFNQQTLRDLAGFGMQGTQGSNALQATLAALISGNTMAAGNAQGAGTIGGSNAINNAISQILAQVMGNRTINSFGGG
jgi:hypothetical protein